MTHEKDQTDFIEEIISEFQELEKLSYRGYKFRFMSFLVNTNDDNWKKDIDEVGPMLKRASSHSSNIRVLALIT
jgi:hypothetical protein